MRARICCSRFLKLLMLVVGLSYAGAAVAQTFAPTRYPPQGAQYVEGTAMSQNWLYSGGNSLTGDYTGANVVFFEIPDTTTQTLYFAIRNPDVDAVNGTGTNDPDRSIIDGPPWVNYVLIGGTGALSSVAGQHLDYTTANNGGTILDSRVGSSYTGAFAVGTWVYFKGVSPSQGEHIGNKYYFRLTAITPGYGSVEFKHAYQFDASLSNTGSPSGLLNGYAFSYDITFAQLITVETWNFYPFVPFGAGTPMTVATYAFNYASSGNVTINSWKDNLGTTLAAPAMGTGLATSTYAVAAPQSNAVWHLQFSTNGSLGRPSGAGELYFSIGGSLLRMYAATYSPPAADHVVISPATASTVTGGSLTSTLQIVDISGNPLQYIGTAQVSITGAPGMLINGLAPPQNITTNASGLATFTLTDGAAETGAISLTTNGSSGTTSLPGTDGTAAASFLADPPPTASSLSNTSFLTSAASPQALPSIVVTDTGTSNIASTNNLTVIIPAGLGAIFDTTVTTVTVTGANAGTWNVTYANGNKTAVIAVVGNPIALGSTTIAGLRLASPFTASSGSLGIAWNGSTTTAQATDDKVITIQSTGTSYTWYGGTSTDPTVGANWVGGSGPVLNNGTENVIIPNGCAHYPVLPAGAVNISALSLDTGATITLGTANNLTLSGALSNAGTIIIPGTGTINKSDATQGTVKYTGASQTILNLGYYDLWLAGSGTYAMSAALSGLHALTISSGTLNQALAVSALNLNLGSNSVAAITNNAALTVTGTLTVHTTSLGNVTLTNAGNAFGNNIVLTSGGAVNLYNSLALSASGSVSTSLILSSASTITQGGAIGVPTLRTTGVGGITLNSANTVSTAFCASNTGSGNVSFTNTGTISLGDATLSGVSTVSGGSVTIANTGQVTSAYPVSAGTGTVKIDTGGATSILQGGSGLITADSIQLQTGAGSTGIIGASGTPLLTASNGADTATLTPGHGGSLLGAYLSHTGALSLATPSLAANAPLSVTASGLLSLPGTAIGTGTGALALSSGLTLSTAASLSSSSSVSLTAGGGVLTLAHNVTGGNVTLTATGAILQAANSLTGGALSAKTKNDIGSAITLGQPTNHFTAGVTLLARNALDSAAAAGAITYVDSGAFAIAAGAAGGVHSLATASLTAGGAVTQTTGTITANGLLLLGAGSYSLTNTGNAVGTIAALLSGGASSLSYTDSAGLGVGSVISTSGIGVGANSLTLVSGGSLTQTQSITCGALASTSAGGAALTNVSNSVASFTATNTGGGAIQLTDSAASLTLAAGGITQSGTSGAITILCNAANAVLTNAGALASLGGAVSLTADDMSLGGSIGAGAGGATIKTATLGRAIDLGTNTAGELGLTNAELLTITTTGLLTLGETLHTGAVTISAALGPTNATGGVTIVNQAGGILIKANLSVSGVSAPLTLTANGGGAAAGAITRTAGTLAATGLVTLNAATGIGVIGGTPVATGNIGGLASTNTTANDIYIQNTSGNPVTLGGGGYSITESPVNGNIQFDSTSGGVVIGGNISVTGAAGSIALNAAGTITDPLGHTVSAGTVKLGVGSATSVGASGVPIMTQASTLLGAGSSAGAIYLSNTGALADASVAATGGLVNLQTNAALSLVTGNITSSNSTVTINASGLLTVGSGRSITAGAASLLKTTSAGLSNSGTMTGPGGVTVDAGSSTLTNSGTISNSSGALAISLTADKMALGGGSIVGGSAAVSLLEKTAGVTFDLGSATDLAASTVELSAAELNTIGTSGFLKIGDASSGAMAISAAVGPTGAQNVHLTSSGNIGGVGTLTATNLAVSAAGAINMTSASVALFGAASTAAAQGITLSDTNAAGMSVGSVDGVVGVTSTNGSISVTESAGLLTLNQLTNAGTSSVSLTGVGVTNSSTVTGQGGISVAAGTGTFTNSAGAILTTSNAASTISLTATDWSLLSAAGSITTGTGAGSIILTPNSNGNMTLGAGGELTTAELATLTTAGTVYMGDSGVSTAYTGTIDIVGAVSFPITVPNAKLKARGGGGAITDSSGAAIGMSAGTGNLSFDADGGIGVIASTKPVVLGAVGGTFTSNNQTSGDLYIKTSGAVTLGTGNPGLTECSGGALRVDSVGNLIIGGNITVAGAGGSISLNAAGTITEQSAGVGTLTASSVALGASLTSTGVGTFAAPVLVSTSAIAASSTGASTGVYVTSTGAAALTVGVASLGLATTSSSQSIVLKAAGNVTVSQPVSANGSGTVTLQASAGASKLTNSSSISSTSGIITLQFDSLSLSGGTTSTIGANAYLLPLTNNTTSSLGGSSTFDLETGDLTSITASTIFVGENSTPTRTSGAMSIGSSTAVNIGTSNLTISGTSIEGGANALTAGTISFKSANGIGDTTTVLTSGVTLAFANTATNAVSLTNTRAAGVSVSGTNSANGAAISIAESSGTLTIGALNLLATGSGTVNLTANDMTLTGTVKTDAASSTGAVNITSYTPAQAIYIGNGSSGGLGLSAAELNQVLTSGTLTLGDSSHTGTITSDGNLGLLATGPSGPVQLQTSGGNISLVTYNLSTQASLKLDTTGSGAATGGAVSGTGALLIGPAGGSTLTVAATNGISLSSDSNKAATVSLSNGSTAGNVLFHNNENCTISLAQNLFPNGAVTLVNNTGSLALGTITSTGATSYISISSAGAATQTGANFITAPGGLELRGSGSFTLTHSTNNVATLAANLTGAGQALQFTNSGALGIGSVNGVSGITTTGGAVTLTLNNAASDLTVSQPITTNAAAGGTVTLNPTRTIYLNYDSASGDVIKTNAAAVSLQKPAVIQKNTSLTAGSGANATSFSSTLDAQAAATYSCTVNGDASFGGSVGTTSLASLTVTGATTTGAGAAGITTSGAQTYDGSVTLGADTTFTAASAQLLWFKSTLAGSGSARKVTVTNADVKFDGAVGGGNLISSLSVDGATAANAAAITTTGAGGQTYVGAVTLGTGLTFTGASGSFVWFKTTLGGGGSTQTASIATANAQFDGTVGGVGNLVTSLTVGGTTALNSGSVTTSSFQDYQGNVTLGADSTFTAASGSLVRFRGTVDGSGGARSVHVATADARFDGSLGTVLGNVSTLTVDGATAIYAPTIRSTSTQTYSGPVTVAANAALYSSGNAAIALSSSTTIDDGFTLTLGNGGATGSFTATSIAGLAGAASSNLTINTTNTLSVSGAMGTDIGTILLTNSGGTTFQSTVNAATITLTATAGIIEFDDALTVTSGLSTGAASSFALSFNQKTGAQSSTIAGATTLQNSGTITLGNDPADVVLFSGGLSVTGGGALHLIGAIRSSAGPLTLASSILDGNATLDSTNNGLSVAGATISLGGVSIGAGSPTLVVNAGNTGGFTQSSGTIAVTSLRIIAGGSIGSSMATPVHTAVANLEALSYLGTVFLANTGAVNIGFVGGDFEALVAGGIRTLVANNAGLASTGAISFTILKPTTAGASGSFTATAPDLNIGTPITGNGGIFLYPNVDAIGIALNDATGGFSLTTTELLRLVSTGTVTIGLGSGTGSNNVIRMGSSGQLGLGTTGYNLTLNSANANLFFDASAAPILGLSADKSLSIAIGTGAIVGSGTLDIALPKTVVGGVLIVTSAGNIGTGTGVNALQTQIDQLSLSSSGNVYLSEMDALQLGNGVTGLSSSGGLLNIAAGGALTMVNTVSTTGSGTSISLSGSSIAVSQNVAAANNGQINLTSTTGGITRSAGTVGQAGSTSILALSSATGIGVDTGADNLPDSTWLFTDVGSVRGSAANGGVFVDEANAVQLGDATAGLSAVNGNLDVTAGGAITTGTSNPIGVTGAASDLYLAGSALTLETTVNGADVVSLTGNSSGITIDAASGIVNGGTGQLTVHNALTQSAGTINGGSGQLLFDDTVTHSGGAIDVGTGGAKFVAAYTASLTAALNGSTLTNPDIEFDADCTLANFTHNGDRIVFAGSSGLQQFSTNSQLIGNVLVNNTTSGGSGVVAGGSDIRQTGASHTLILQSGYLDLHTNGIGWVADSAATAPTAATFHGVAGSLTLDASTQLLCDDFTIETGYSINNVGANTVAVYGDANLACPPASFLTATNSTIDMRGAGKTLTTTALTKLGNLTMSGSITLGAALAMVGNMSITGSLDVSASSSYQITIDGNWSNIGTFIPETGTVSFTGATQNPIYVSGNNTWFIFDCETSTYNISVYFENNKTQTITNSGTFKIHGSSAHPITLSRQTPDQVTDLLWNPILSAPDPTKMWQIDLLATPNATLDMTYVNVMFSDARAHPLGVPNTVTVITLSGVPAPFTGLTCYQWIDAILAVYGYTEDSDHNGKIDRIRVVSESALNGGATGFANFRAVVNGYDVDTSKGYGGYNLVQATDNPPPQVSGTEFFIYLKEKPYNDTSALPTWYIASNPNLKDSTTGNFWLADISTPMPTASCAPPIIAHTLALPGQSQVFYHFSGPVYESGGAQITAASFIGASSLPPANRITTSGNGTSEALPDYGSPIDLNTILAGTLYSVSPTLNDNLGWGASAPHDYSTDSTWLLLGHTLPSPYNYNHPSGWPNPIQATSHRVSDVLISVPMAAAADQTYFMWPIYAKDQIKLSLTDAEIAALTPAQSAAQGIGLIRAFDDSQWLRADDIKLQALLQSSIAGGLTGVKLWFDSRVPSTLQSNGLWLPSFLETGFSGLVPYPDAAPWGHGASSLTGTSIGSNLWNFTFPKTDSRIVSPSTLGFFFTFVPPAGGEPLYGARLDVATGAAVPVNWYRLVKPYQFDIHDVRLQRGGASILNNVIDPTKGETVRLSYQLGSQGAVTVTVFTLDGDVVKRLVLATQSAGDYAVDWDGKNLSGRPVARGIYFIRIVAPGIDEIRKVLVVRK